MPSAPEDVIMIIFTTSPIKLLVLFFSNSSRRPVGMNSHWLLYTLRSISFSSAVSVPVYSINLGFLLLGISSVHSPSDFFLILNCAKPFASKTNLRRPMPSMVLNWLYNRCNPSWSSFVRLLSIFKNFGLNCSNASGTRYSLGLSDKNFKAVCMRCP